MKSAGYAVILASVATALLPAWNFASGPLVIGLLMIGVGLLEAPANAFRKKGRWAAMAAGIASIAAGALLVARPETSFAGVVHVVIGWLVLRAILLAMSAFETPRRVKRMPLIAAAIDLTLAAVVWIGLTASALVIALFGPTEHVIGDFAWVLAISFICSGLLLLGFAGEHVE